MGEKNERADGMPGAEPPTGLLFQHLTDRSALSPGKVGVAAVLTAGAVLLVPLDVWKWATEGAPFPLAVLCLPLGAYGAWGSVASEEEWSSSGRLRLKRAGKALAVVFGALFLYGTYAWWWRNGGVLLPVFSLLYVSLVLSPRRRRRGTAPSRAV